MRYILEQKTALVVKMTDCIAVWWSQFSDVYFANYVHNIYISRCCINMTILIFLDFQPPCNNKKKLQQIFEDKGFVFTVPGRDWSKFIVLLINIMFRLELK